MDWSIRLFREYLSSVKSFNFKLKKLSLQCGHGISAFQQDMLYRLTIVPYATSVQAFHLQGTQYIFYHFSVIFRQKTFPRANCRYYFASTRSNDMFQREVDEIQIQCLIVKIQIFSFFKPTLFENWIFSIKRLFMKQYETVLGSI